MTLLRLVLKEIMHYKLTFFTALISVVVAVGVFVAELTILKAFDLETSRIIAEKEKKTEEDMRRMEDDYRKIMKELGFNLLILPQEQRLENFYDSGYASKFMPEEYVDRLSRSNIVTIRHLLPSIEQKIRWPEQGNRNIIIVGTRGEVPFLHRDPKEPILVAVPPGTIVMGFEIWNSLKLKSGENVKVLGEEFKITRCHPQRGTKDDITVWIDLNQAQQLLHREGRINAILALKCHCAGVDLSSIREDITRILPDTRIVELGNKVTTRAKARDRAKAAADSALAAERIYRDRIRQEHEVAASWLIPLVIIGCSAFIGILAFNNVRERRSEIGILRALGLQSRQILFVFLAKAWLLGLIGALLGSMAGFFIALVSSGVAVESQETLGLFNPVMLIFVLLATPLFSSIASWIPALIAARQDPADILREE